MISSMAVRKIIFLSVGTAAIAVPDFGEVLAHRKDLRFFFRRQGMPFTFKTGKLLPGRLDLFQLFVPAAFQFSGSQTVSGVDHVILFECPLRFVLQLLKLIRQGGALRSISGTQFINGFQTGFDAEARYYLQQFLTEPTIHGSTTEADAVLPAVIIVAFA